MVIVCFHYNGWMQPIIDLHSIPPFSAIHRDCSEQEEEKYISTLYFNQYLFH